MIKFDGLWIDMNEPANFVAGDLNKGCSDNQINYPDYIPNVSFSQTFKICLNKNYFHSLYFGFCNFFSQELCFFIMCPL